MKQSVTDTHISQLVDSCNQFACDLFAILSKDHDQNICFSPSSIAMALGMLCAGANGKTAQEILRTLRFEGNSRLLHESFMELANRTQTGEAEFHLANRLWGQLGYEFQSDLLETLSAYYGAEVGRVDFQHEPVSACQEVNDWIAEKTAGKITDLLSPSNIGPLTRLILTNAFYFKGVWENEFNEDLTVEQPFQLVNGDDHTTHLMKQNGHQSYLETENFQILEIPYRRRSFEEIPILDAPEEYGYELKEKEDSQCNLVLDLFLPKSPIAVPELTVDLLQHAELTSFVPVNSFIPRFKFEYSNSLSESLKSLGLQNVFEPNADFSHATDDPQGLVVNEVFHQAMIELNERGTEAAGATMLAVCLGAPDSFEEPIPVTFKADHPFAFVIRDAETGMVHFMGRVMQP